MDTRGLPEEIRDRLAILLDIAPEDIADDIAFSDLGVDSMMRLELVALVEQRVGFELPESDLGELQTIETVVRYVDSLAA
ncbi:MAG: acyl carrier protein [Acidobacteriota bacterium]